MVIGSYEDDVSAYLDDIYSAIHDIDLYDYEDVKALTRKGYGLLNKLRSSARRLNQLARLGGKYSPILKELASERATLIKLVEDAISDLWDEYRDSWRGGWDEFD